MLYLFSLYTYIYHKLTSTWKKENFTFFYTLLLSDLSLLLLPSCQFLLYFTSLVSKQKCRITWIWILLTYIQIISQQPTWISSCLLCRSLFFSSSLAIFSNCFCLFLTISSWIEAYCGTLYLCRNSCYLKKSVEYQCNTSYVYPIP